MGDAEFALHVSDMRVLQTLRLLEATMKDHSEQGLLTEIMQALSATRDNILKLRDALKTEGEYCA